MTNDNDSPFTTTTKLPPVIKLHPDFGNPSQLFNMRDWLQRAVETQGAKMTGSGIGMGAADIDIDLEGHGYNITIRPRLK